MDPFFLWASLVMSAASFFLAVFTYLRTGRWKEAEALKALADKVAVHETRLAQGEERFEQLATREDVATVKAEVHALEKTVDKVDAGVIRIERILMESGR